MSDDPQTPAAAGRRRPRWKRTLLGLGVSLVVLIFVEGLSSSFLFLWDLSNSQRALPERVHTAYDPELGWVNLPDMDISDLYAPGIGFHSNSQGFRNAADLPVAVPAGRVRILCTGDSFTLGYGVADDASWPAFLEQQDERFETVNMGQGGYGIDQAYLWYRRDGVAIDHDLVLFAFIADDFRRMQHDQFLGYGKPLLALEGGELVVGNTPVPRGSFRFPWLTQNANLLRRLRSLELLTRMRNKVAPSAPPAPPVPDDEARRITEQLFADLREIVEGKGARLALVLLPNLEPGSSDRLLGLDAWARAACDAAVRSGTPLLDLTTDFAALSPDELATLFIPRGEIQLLGASGHYSVRGNEFVARAVHRRLRDRELIP